MKKLIKLLGVIGMSFILVLSLIVPVNAQEKPKIKKEEMKENFMNMEIDEKTTEKLIMKLENGEELDSFKKEFENIEPYETIEEDLEITEKFVYPDGSRKIVTIEATPNGITTGKISGGDREAGTYWYNWKDAKVSASWGVITASFYADFEGSRGFGRINKARDPSISVLGGTFRSKSLDRTRINATQYNDAVAQLYFVAEGLQDIGSTTVYLRLRVPYNGNAYAKMQV
ncbi:hypothetical protein [Senegalia sp. (in: firmicutes)]|uniref:hypothetical protein n=1 Tax=Senegalia sp. (in: firmicutes) TaxID=1924098 RepID=UPI003F99BA4B